MTVKRALKHCDCVYMSLNEYYKIMGVVPRSRSDFGRGYCRVLEYRLVPYSELTKLKGRLRPAEPSCISPQCTVQYSSVALTVVD